MENIDPKHYLKNGMYIICFYFKTLITAIEEIEQLEDEKQHLAHDLKEKIATIELETKVFAKFIEKVKDKISRDKLDHYQSILEHNVLILVGLIKALEAIEKQ